MRQPRFDDDEQRRNAYDNERPDRWSLEDVLLDPVAELVCRQFSRHEYNATYEKYAEGLIREFQNTHPGVDIPDYVLGAPDLLISIDGKVWFVEIKIKRKRYMNTINGSRIVRRYGCPSQYLDVVPVYTNMVAFTDHYSIAKDSIILLYCVNPNASVKMGTPLIPMDWQFEGIDLQRLQANVEAGRYQRYGQGYGQIAWLVRCDDLMQIRMLCDL